MTDKFEIREFREGDLEKFTEHWKGSVEGWPAGFERSGDFSTEAVKELFFSMSFIKFWLGWLGDTIVGFLTYHKFGVDPEATYVGTFNVHPDFHGKGYGRRLLTHCVDRAIADKVKRLDLHTWAANEKAFPLYKKCGFFWRPRIQYVHMYNFLPQVCNNPVVKDFIGDSWWYEIMRPKTEIRQDSDLINGCAYHRYMFEKDGRSLEVLVDPSTSGITGMRSDQFSIRCDVPGLTHVAGIPQEVTWTVESASIGSQPITVKYEGDGQFDYGFEKSFDSSGETEFRTSITPPPEIKPEKINWYGKPLNFIVNAGGYNFSLTPGLRVVKPFKAESVPCPIFIEPSFERDFVINLKSNINLEATFTPEVKTGEGIEIISEPESREYDVSNENAFGLPLRLRSSEMEGMSWIEIVGNLKINGNKYPIAPVKIGVGTAPTGRPLAVPSDDPDCTVLSNGLVSIMASRRGGSALLELTEKNERVIHIGHDGIGMPYSIEARGSDFDIKSELSSHSGALVYRMSSRDFPGIDLEKRIRIGSSNLVSLEVSLINNSVKEFSGWFKSGLSNWEIIKITLPLKDRIVSGSRETFLNGQIPLPTNPEMYPERWMAFQISDLDGVLGIIFDGVSKISWETWNPLTLEWEVNNLKPGERADLSPVKLLVNATGWKEVQKFALKSKPSELPLIEFPFVFPDSSLIADSKPYRIMFNVYRKGDNRGVLTAKTCDGRQYKTESDKWSMDDPLVLELPDPAGKGQLDVIDYTLDRMCTIEEGGIPVICPRPDTEIRISESSEGGLKYFTVNNGVLEFSISPDFAGSLTALRHMGNPDRNLVNSSFPEKSMWTWFNPWFGGLSPSFEVDYQFHESNYDGEPVVISWMGHEWEGIRVVVKPLQEWASLGVEYFYMTHAGCPVVLQLVRLTENGSCSRQPLMEQAGMPCPSGDTSRMVIGVADENGRRLKQPRSEGGAFGSGSPWLAFTDPEIDTVLGFAVNSGLLAIWDAAEDGQAFWWTKRISTIPNRTVESAQIIVVTDDVNKVAALSSKFSMMGRSVI